MPEKLGSIEITYNENGVLGSGRGASGLHDIHGETLEVVELRKIKRHRMGLTILLIVHKTFIQSVESVNHFLRPTDRNWESERLLWARVAKLLNEVVIFFIWRERLCPAQTPVTRPGR